MAKKAKAEAKKDYLYEGRDKNDKKVSGHILSTSIVLAKADLRKQGVIVSRIRKKPKPLFQQGSRISPKDIALFFRQMATMMKAGVAIVESFDIVIEGVTNPRMVTLLQGVKANLESGNSFTDSLRNYRQYFDELTCSLVEAGENSGTLDAMLARVASYKEKTEALKSKVKKAMIYPIAVLSVALIVSAVLLIWVVPQFEQLFDNFGADLPLFTKMVITLSEGLQQWWYLVVMTALLLATALKTLHRRSAKFRHSLDRVILKIPIFGDIIVKSIWARFARTLSTTFAAGVPLLDCLQSVSGTVGNRVYGSAIERMIEDIATGQQLQFAMRASNLFPSMMLQMVAIGEEAGSLDEMLSKVADFFEEEVDNKVEGLSSLLEPLIIVILGVLIGGLIVAMYLPIFKMGSVVG